MAVTAGLGAAALSAPALAFSSAAIHAARSFTPAARSAITAPVWGKLTPNVRWLLSRGGSISPVCGSVTTEASAMETLPSISPRCMGGTTRGRQKQSSGER